MAWKRLRDRDRKLPPVKRSDPGLSRAHDPNSIPLVSDGVPEAEVVLNRRFAFVPRMAQNWTALLLGVAGAAALAVGWFVSLGLALVILLALTLFSILSRR